MDDNEIEKSESPEHEEPGNDFIHTIEKLIEDFPGRGISKKHSLLILIKSYYKTNDDEFNVKTISTEELTLSIYPILENQDEEVSKYIEKKRKSFSSLKSSLNKTLRQMWDDGLNPSNVLISKSNTFNFTTDTETDKNKDPGTDAFLKKIKKALEKEGGKSEKDFEKELNHLVQEQLNKIKEVAEKSILQKTTKRLEKQVKEKNQEVDALKKEIDNLKESISFNNKKSPAVNEEALPQSGAALFSNDSKESDESALLDKLAQIVRDGLKKELPLLSNSDHLVEELEKKLTDKEKKIIQLMENLTEKELLHHKEKQEYKDRLEEKYREEQKSLKEKIDKLSQERSKSIQEKTDLITERMELEKKNTPELEKIEINYEEERTKLIGERRKISKRVSEMIDEEKKFLAERDFARRGFVIKEENIQKMAADQMIAGMELSDAKEKFEKERRSFKEELNKKFEKEMEALNEDFQTQKDLLYNERMEIFKKSDEVEEEWSKLRKKEEEISKKVESAVEERLAEKNRELAKREEELNTKQEKIAIEEKLLNDEKKELVSQMKAGIGGKTSLLKLKELIKKQEELLSKKHDLLESESSMKQRLLEGFKSKAKDIAIEAEARSKFIKTREKELEELSKKLSIRAQEINNEKNEALKKYKERFDTLIKKKEAEFIEKEREINKKIDALQISEKELLEKKQQQLELEKEATKRIAEKEDEAIKLLEGNLLKKKNLVNSEEKLLEESAMLNKTYQERLNQLQSRFKEKVESINNRFSKLSTRELELLEKEKFLNGQSESFESGYDQTIHKKENEIEQNKSEGLINIKDFEIYKRELQEIREELDNASRNRTSVYQEKAGNLENSIDEHIGKYIKTLLSKLGEESIKNLFANSTLGEGKESDQSGKVVADKSPTAGEYESKQTGTVAGVAEVTRLENELNQMKKSFSEIEKVIKNHEAGSNFPGLESSNEIRKTLNNLAGGLSGAVDLLYGQGDGIASKESFVKPRVTLRGKNTEDDTSVSDGFARGGVDGSGETEKEGEVGKSGYADTEKFGDIKGKWKTGAEEGREDKGSGGTTSSVSLTTEELSRATGSGAAITSETSPSDKDGYGGADDLVGAGSKPNPALNSTLNNDLKISSKHDEDGAAITFGGGNLFTKKVEREISAQIISFNGNIEEFATSPAFLNAIAQKYNASVLIPAGEFEMGDDRIHGASPRHTIKVECPFVISKYPITNLQFLQFTKETGYMTSAERKLLSCITVSGGKKEIKSSDNIVKGYVSKNLSFIVDRDACFKNPFGKGSDIAEKYTHPVTQVTWWDAIAYCKWLTENTGIKYRLPSEVEWEYVASNRGMLKPDRFFWPDSEPHSKHCNYLESLFGDTSPVDYFSKNQTIDGICDMLGNVREWTQGDYFPYSEKNKSDSRQSGLKVIRGYGFIDPISKVSFCIRRPERPLHASSFIGFRVVCEET